MSYAERIENTYHATYAEVRPWIFFYKADKLTDEHDIKNADETAEREIAELQSLIDDLKEYRQALAARYAQLQTMTYSERLEIRRFPANWDGVHYEVLIVARFEDGTERQTFFRSFPGKERHKALALFEEMRKQRPGIETVKDIAKKSWE